MNTTGKIMEIETTEAEIKNLREQGTPENEIPEAGTKRRYIRAQHIAPRSEHKIKVEIHLDGDVLDFLRSRSGESYEKQINGELRKLMESERENEIIEMKRKILNDNDFLRELKDKLKAA
ncbi:MAG: hypothetical protein ACR2F2_06270 [Pyrinomonadaceae bacterium]